MSDSNVNVSKEFPYAQPIVNALKKMGFEALTEIQAQTIPAALDGKDLIALAETGSGKTVAFLIPAFTKLLKAPREEAGKQILVLAPTRELAGQIIEVVKQFTQFMPGISATCLIGGVQMDRQIGALKRRPSIVIATPGRLIDHQKRRTIDLRNFNMLVLDEADRMFDMGFAPQVREVVKYLPKERQTMLFSATLPEDIRTLANSVLINPVRIAADKNMKPPAQIQQKMVEVDNENKNNKTLELLDAATGAVMIFTRTKHRTDRLAKFLFQKGVQVARLHGDRSQSQRTQAIHGFRNGQYKVLVATDIAARGIDISHVSDVINYDLPMTVEDYVHRIGRTGRAGREGQALTLVTPFDRKDWQYIARKMNIGGADQSQDRGHKYSQRHAHTGKSQQAHKGGFGKKHRAGPPRPQRSEDRGFEQRPEKRHGFTHGHAAAPKRERTPEDAQKQWTNDKPQWNKPRQDKPRTEKAQYDQPKWGKPKFKDGERPERRMEEKRTGGDEFRQGQKRWGKPKPKSGSRPHWGGNKRNDKNNAQKW